MTFCSFVDYANLKNQRQVKVNLKTKNLKYSKGNSRGKCLILKKA